MDKNNFVILGHILKPQGNKGELRISLEFQFIDLIEDFAESNKILFIEDSLNKEPIPLKIEEFWYHSRGFGIFKFFEINSINEAEKYAGKDIYIALEDRWKLPEGMYYVDQLVGLSVFDNNKNKLGMIKEVIFNTGNDIYVVSDSEKFFYLPAVKEFIKKIDLAEKVMIVSIPEGLEDLMKKGKEDAD